jgi:hypothetical protein
MSNDKDLKNATSKKVQQVFSKEELNNLTPRQENALSIMLGRAAREKGHDLTVEEIQGFKEVGRICFFLRFCGSRARYHAGRAKAPVLATAELYRGKLVAALDRQHRRDLFDIHCLLCLHREYVGHAGGYDSGFPGIHPPSGPSPWWCTLTRPEVANFV